MDLKRSKGFGQWVRLSPWLLSAAGLFLAVGSSAWGGDSDAADTAAAVAASDAAAIAQAKVLCEKIVGSYFSLKLVAVSKAKGFCGQRDFDVRKAKGRAHEQVLWEAKLDRAAQPDRLKDPVLPNTFLDFSSFKISLAAVENSELKKIDEIRKSRTAVVPDQDLPFAFTNLVDQMIVAPNNLIFSDAVYVFKWAESFMVTGSGQTIVSIFLNRDGEIIYVYPSQDPLNRVGWNGGKIHSDWASLNVGSVEPKVFGESARSIFPIDFDAYEGLKPSTPYSSQLNALKKPGGVLDSGNVEKFTQGLLGSIWVARSYSEALVKCPKPTKPLESATCLAGTSKGSKDDFTSRPAILAFSNPWTTYFEFSNSDKNWGMPADTAVMSAVRLYRRAIDNAIQVWEWHTSQAQAQAGSSSSKQRGWPRRRKQSGVPKTQGPLRKARSFGDGR